MKKQKLINDFINICEVYKLTEVGYGIISHPIFNSKVALDFKTNKMIMLTEKNKDEVLQLYREKFMECKDPLRIWFMMNKPYRLSMLFLLQQYLNEKEFNKVLKYSWTSVEFPHQMRNLDILVMFTKSSKNLLMSASEFRRYYSLPDNVTVYRGIQGKKSKIHGFSWTLDIKKAEWFANRFSKKGSVYSALISKKDIYMYTNARSEEEIVLNPFALRNIKNITR
jgi:hypothetical protein